MKKHSSHTAQNKTSECVYGALSNNLTDFIIFRDVNLFLTLKYIEICFSVFRPSLTNITMCRPTEKVSEGLF
jgi:lipoprotein signal peptidase